MPAFASHYILSDQIFQYMQKSSASIAGLIEDNRAAYNWGSQGPDLLYFYKIWNPKLRLADLGSLMHSQKTTELFFEMNSYISKRRNSSDYNILSAYFYGFITHYYFDSLLHPYVYYLQNIRYKDNPNHLPIAHHNCIESGIDSLLYLRFYGKPVTRLNTKASFPASAELKNSLAGLYHHLLLHVYGIDYDIEPLKKCVGSASRISRLLFDRTSYVFTRVAGCISHVLPTHGLLQSFIHKKHAPESLLNTGRLPWHYPDTPTRICRDSVMDLFEKSISLSVDRICLYDQSLKSGHAESILYGSNFLDGKTPVPCELGRLSRYDLNRYSDEGTISAS